MLRAQNKATVDSLQGACRKTLREARGFAAAGSLSFPVLFLPFSFLPL